MPMTSRGQTRPWVYSQIPPSSLLTTPSMLITPLQGATLSCRRSTVLRLLTLLLLRLIKGLLFLLRSILIDLHILLIIVTLLKVLKSTLPDSTESRSRVSSNAAPSRLSAEELDTGRLGGKGVVQGSSGPDDTVDTTDILEGVVTEDVLGDERAAIEDHDGLALAATTVRHNSGLRENVLLELAAPSIVDSDLDLLYNKHDGADIAVLVLHVALAEEVVQVVVEAVVDLVDDKNLLDLLHNLLLAAVVDDLDVLLLHLDLLLTAVVDNLEVLLLDLDDLLLLVEVVEAVDEVERAIVCVETINDRAKVGLTLRVAREGDRGVDGLGGYEESVSVF
jgi:hypothetical protein